MKITVLNFTQCGTLELCKKIFGIPHWKCLHKTEFVSTATSHKYQVWGSHANLAGGVYAVGHSVIQRRVNYCHNWHGGDPRPLFILSQFIDSSNIRSLTLPLLPGLIFEHSLAVTIANKNHFHVLSWNVWFICIFMNECLSQKSATGNICVHPNQSL